MKQMTIKQIAAMIRKDWTKVDPHAEPYLKVMEQLTTIKDKYYADSGKMVVAYFLANAVSWRGDLARNIKKELNRRLTEN